MLFKIHEKKNFKSETFFKAVNIFDRFMFNSDLKNITALLGKQIAISCLRLAEKLDENSLCLEDYDLNQKRGGKGVPAKILKEINVTHAQLL